jgi:hypothetical protein
MRSVKGSMGWVSSGGRDRYRYQYLKDILVNNNKNFAELVIFLL